MRRRVSVMRGQGLGARLAALMAVGVLAGACTAGGSSPTPTTTATRTASPTATPAPTEVPPDQVTGSLTVLDWSGYEQEMFWQDFKNTYKHASVAFEFGNSDAEQFTKMKAGSQADVFHPYTGWLQFYVDEGLVAEIDTTRLKNWSKVPDSFKAIGQINGKQYFVPWDWGFTSILYRTDKIASVDSWTALLDPKYKGHVS